jgi:hypothetical protein
MNNKMVWRLLEIIKPKDIPGIVKHLTYLFVILIFGRPFRFTQIECIGYGNLILLYMVYGICYNPSE